MLVVAIAAIGGGAAVGVASGRWWVGLIVALIIGWMAVFLGIGLVGAVRVEREARLRREARAREDPIGRLLPNRRADRRAVLDPASYRELLSLPDRPVLILDDALFDQRTPGAIGALAARGRMPEPETLAVSRLPAGTWVLGIALLGQSPQLWVPALGALRAGAPVTWSPMLGLALTLLGLLAIGLDPWVRRKLGLTGIFGRDAVIGAGWLVDRSGRTWTVEDTVVLVTSRGTDVEVRLLHPERVHSFYLPILLRNRPGRGADRPKPRGLGGRARTLAREALSGGAEAVGLEAPAAPDADMPGPGEPLRLLLSSWTYPEPRPDLAPRRN